MIEPDTLKLLRECDAGIKMGIEAIEEVLPQVHSEEFKKLLSENREKHIELKEEIENLLADYQDDGKDPPLSAQIMSQIKTRFKMLMNPDDNAVADLITDGGNMGIKSLNRYQNQYKAADKKSKDIAEKLIKIEKELVSETKQFL